MASTSFFLASPESVLDTSWYVDSGATNHIIADMKNLCLTADYKGKQKLMVGNGKIRDITHVGHSRLNIYLSNTSLQLKNILRIPHINLISISKLMIDNHIFVEFHSDVCFLKDKTTGTGLPKGKLKDGLYQFSEPIKVDLSSTLVSQVSASSLCNKVCSKSKSCSFSCFATNSNCTESCNSFLLVVSLALKLMLLLGTKD